MDYEKAYEDALERAKGIYNENPSSSTAKFVCGQIFPELKESEDERIRKTLLKLVSNDKNNGYTDFYKAEGITCDDAIAYLEKQKEQKPAEGDNETEIQKAFREGKSAGRKEVFDHPEEYGLQEEQQEPAEWSEEDEKIWKDIFDLCNRFGYDDACRLLKSISRRSWKPGKEQMKSFAQAVGTFASFEHLKDDSKVLTSLYNDLKKL